MSEDAGYRPLTISARDGLKLHVRDYDASAAAALPVICLPGLARNGSDFHELALALSGDAKRPRRVLALDYRGRGRSAYDPEWTHYEIKTELDDMLQVMAATGVNEAVFVGTSRGGLVTMAMAPVRPAAIKGVVLNDVGPVIDAQGLIRIRNYVGKMPSPRDWNEAAAILKQLFGGQFPILNGAEWDGFARRTWTMRDGRLVPDYDPALMKTLAALDLEAPLPVLWPFFEGLKHAPMLVLRGANSDLLSDETLRQMAERHPTCATFTVPGQGHAPLLSGKDVIGRIARLCASADQAAGR